MLVIEFKEHDKFSLNEFFEKVSKYSNLHDAKKILERLELSHCVKHYISNVDNSSHYKNSYAFDFVGIIIIDRYCFLVYPKYWNNIYKQTNKVEKFNRVLEVIDKYNKSIKFNLGNINNSINTDRLSISVSILKEYLSKGLYSNEESLIELNGDGQILWEKTIEDNIAYIQHETPIYLDLYTKTKQVSEKDIIRKLHAAIISEIYEEIHSLLSYIGLNFNFQLTNEKTEDFGPENYLLYLIDNELSQQFISDKQEILHNMKNYIKEQHNKYTETFQVYGTTSFHFVWEEVCSIVYDNDLDKSMDVLNLHKTIDWENKTKPKNITQNWGDLKLKDFVEKPSWVQNNKIAFSNRTLTLDVLAIDQKSKIFHIFDAKYYLIDFDYNNSGELSISGQPGVEDITKQYLYQLAYKDLAKNNNYSFSNSFIVPKDNLTEEELPNSLGRGKILGKAQLKMLSNLGLDSITIIGRDCHTIFKRFLEKS